MRVIIVDDHLAVARMLRDAVEDVEGFQVVGTAPTAGEAAALCGRLQPDIVILDLGLGRESGLTLIPRLKPARVIVFSGMLGGAAVRRALAAGADGLIEKQASLDELQAALRAVAAGRNYLSAFADAQLRAPRPRAVRLSERDRALLAALAEGLGSKEISARLGSTTHAVNNLRLRLMKRANLRGSAQLVRYAVSLGLVPDRVEGAAEPE